MTSQGRTNTITGERLRHPARHRVAIACPIGLLLIVLSTVISVSTASAGTWMQVSCDMKTASLPGEGWSGQTSGSPPQGSGTQTSCSSEQFMDAELSTLAPAPVSSGEMLVYEAPSESTIIGGWLDLQAAATGHGPTAYTSVTGSGSGTFFECVYGQKQCPEGGYTYKGEVTIPKNTGKYIHLTVACLGTSGTCETSQNTLTWAELRVLSAHLLLENASIPAAGEFAGGLLEPAARGTENLAMRATDTNGPGVYTVTVEVDGHTVYSSTPDSNEGKCTPTGSTTGGALMFDFWQPCKVNEAITIPIDTTGFADGTHSLKVLVTDAARDTAIVYTGTITTSNAPQNTTPPTIDGPATISPGVLLTVQPGGWEIPSSAGAPTYSYQWERCNSTGDGCEPIAGAQGRSYAATTSDIGHTLRVVVTAADTDGSVATSSAQTALISDPVATGPKSRGAPNGNPASDNAKISLRLHGTLRRPYAKRALMIRGRLVTSRDTPISGATVEVLAQTLDTTKMAPVAQATTAANGSFVAHVPTGPSRLLKVVYRSHMANTTYAAVAKLTESVTAGVRLHITPSHTRSNGTITISGQVKGSIPHQGVNVALEVHYLGRWETFRSLTTNSSGRFSLRYEFQGATGRFPFRTRVLNGQAGFPYTQGYSKNIDVQAH